MKDKTLFQMNYEMEVLLDGLCDEETGEIDEEKYSALKALEIDMNEKKEAWCGYIKQRTAALKAKKELIDNAKAVFDSETKALERTKNAFEMLLGGEKWKGNFSSVYYRTTNSVVLDAGLEGRDLTDLIPNQWLRFKAPELDKTALKAALEAGADVPGVHLEPHTSMCIR